MKSGLDLDIEFGNLAVSEGLVTPEQVYTCQCIVDATAVDNPRMSLDVVMADRGYITPEQEAYLLKMMGITVVHCPQCNKKSKEVDTDFGDVIDCNFCGERIDLQRHYQPDTYQTSVTFTGTLAPSQQKTGDHYIGKLLGEKYDIIERIAVGGWSVIYKAKRKLHNIDDIVAVKILHISLSDNPQDIKRFQNEAATIMELRHPNAIHLYDFVRDENGTTYMAMEFVHGKNLKETIRNDGPFNITRMVNIIFQICNVISAAHKHPNKIIHRDITSQNIMLSRIGELNDFVKVLDFGIAKLRIQDNVSLTGSIVGTPLYMAPEQWRGECDERTDIYSLGVIMYEMLTGETPFKGDQITLMNKHLNEKPQPFRKLNKNLKIPKYIENVIFQCLEKKMNKRPQSVDEVKSLLQKVKCSTSLNLTNYFKSALFVIITIFLSISLVYYLYFLRKGQEKNIPISNNTALFHDTYSEPTSSQKIDNNLHIVQNNVLETFSGKELNKNDVLEDTDRSKASDLSPHSIDYRVRYHTADEKTPNNSKHFDRDVANAQRYDIDTAENPAAIDPDPKEIVQNEIKSWLMEYKRVWEKGDVETLKELGHISSEKEEKKLREHYSYISGIKVSIQNELIETNNEWNQATVSFDRMDEWTDKRGYRHKKSLSRITKTLYKENDTWKIAKKNRVFNEIAKTYKLILNNGITVYANFKKQINERFSR